MGWDGLSFRTQPYYEALGHLQKMGRVIVSCAKLALRQLVQIQVMDSVSDEIQSSIFITNSSILHQSL